MADYRIEKEKEVLLSWFAPVGPEPMHSKAYKAHQPDTCTWFLSGPLKAFKEDSQKRARVLWVQGKCQFILRTFRVKDPALTIVRALSRLRKDTSVVS